MFFSLPIIRQKWYLSAMPHPNSVQALVQRLAFMANALLHAVGIHQVGRIFGGMVPPALVVPIYVRIKSIQTRFERLAPQIVAGTYRPRRTTPRPKPKTPAPKPRPASPFRRFGWLDALLPPDVAQQQRAGLADFLRQPDTLALIEAAPAEMARLFRPLCWALHIKPPPALVSPRRPAGTPPPAPKPYVEPPPPPPPIPAPANTLGLHPIQLLPMRPPSKTA
jgi:hypothetical protein